MCVGDVRSIEDEDTGVWRDAADLDPLFERTALLSGTVSS